MPKQDLAQGAFETRKVSERLLVVVNSNLANAAQVSKEALAKNPDKQNPLLDKRNKGSEVNATLVPWKTQPMSLGKHSPVVAGKL
jgi:hypothetical protein